MDSEDAATPASAGAAQTEKQGSSSADTVAVKTDGKRDLYSVAGAAHRACFNRMMKAQSERPQGAGAWRVFSAVMALVPSYSRVTDRKVTVGQIASWAGVSEGHTGRVLRELHDRGVWTWISTNARAETRKSTLSLEAPTEPRKNRRKTDDCAIVTQSSLCGGRTTTEKQVRGAEGSSLWSEPSTDTSRSDSAAKAADRELNPPHGKTEKQDVTVPPPHSHPVTGPITAEALAKGLIDAEGWRWLEARSPADLRVTTFQFVTTEPCTNGLYLAGLVDKQLVYVRPSDLQTVRVYKDSNATTSLTVNSRTVVGLSRIS